MGMVLFGAVCRATGHKSNFFSLDEFLSSFNIFLWWPKYICHFNMFSYKKTYILFSSAVLRIHITLVRIRILRFSLMRIWILTFTLMWIQPNLSLWCGSGSFYGTHQRTWTLQCSKYSKSPPLHFAVDPASQKDADPYPQYCCSVQQN